MRIVFRDDLTRKSFFSKVKIRANIPRTLLIKNLNISKATFERYLSGKYSIPEKVFSYLLNYFNKKEKEELEKNITKKQDNWGSVLGGRKAYLKNVKYFKIGRLKGMNSINKNRKMHICSDCKINFPLTEKVCEFVGTFIGDGFMNFYRNKLYHIEFTGDNRKDYEYYLKNIIPAIKKVLPNQNPHIKEIEKYNTIRVIFYSKALFNLLHERFKLPKGKKSYIVKIPNEIMNSKDKFINSTIRGIFDTDGCVLIDKRKIYKKPYPRITLQIVSKSLYLQLKEYLSRKFKIYSGYIKKRNVYYLEIYGEEQLDKWMSLIGFSNSRHLNRLALIA